MIVFLVDNNKWYLKNLYHLIGQVKSLSQEIAVFWAERTKPPKELSKFKVFTLTDLELSVQDQLDISVLDGLELAKTQFHNYHFTGLPFVKIFFPLFFNKVPFWYLDSDLYVLPNTNSSFFNVNEKLAMVSEEFSGVERFNSGVIYWDLSKWSESEITYYKKFLVKVLTKNYYESFFKNFNNDQGLLNYFFISFKERYGDDLVTELDRKYNITFLKNTYLTKNTVKDGGLLHFREGSKPDWKDIKKKIELL